MSLQQLRTELAELGVSPIPPERVDEVVGYLNSWVDAMLPENCYTKEQRERGRWNALMAVIDVVLEFDGKKREEHES